eukprot:16433027-Heterocapsa_arctica.AAC.1
MAAAAVCVPMDFGASHWRRTASSAASSLRSGALSVRQTSGWMFEGREAPALAGQCPAASSACRRSCV